MPHPSEEFAAVGAFGQVCYRELVSEPDELGITAPAGGPPPRDRSARCLEYSGDLPHPVVKLTSVGAFRGVRDREFVFVPDELGMAVHVQDVRPARDMARKKRSTRLRSQIARLGSASIFARTESHCRRIFD